MKSYTEWNHRRANHPTRQLGDEFKSYVRRLDPTIEAQQNGQTVTFRNTLGRRAGMRLRAAGLVLAATRNGQELKILMASERDFDAGLKWLQQLPDY